MCLCFRFVGQYLKLCPEHVFVVEDGDGLCGFAVAASDSKHFYEQFKKHWLPEVHVYIYMYIFYFAGLVQGNNPIRPQAFLMHHWQKKQMVFLEKFRRTFYRLMSFDCNNALRISMSCKDV